MLQLYSFSDADRSGKVRWTAAELGIPVDEVRVPFGEHRRGPYATLNPHRRIPTAIYQGQTWYESTAICHLLAESTPSPRLTVAPGEPERAAFLMHLSRFAESLEGRLVESAISRIGLLPPTFAELHAPGLRSALRPIVAALPPEGYLCGERFTIADVVAGYNLRLALQCELVTADDVGPYYRRLTGRPAAVAARVFP